MLGVTKYLNYVRWLSLEIPTGAICVLALVGKELHLAVPLAAYVALFSAVWLIYLVDHWLDSWKRTVATSRRKFHQENAPLIIGLIILSLLCGMMSLFFLPRQVLWWGMGLSLVCGLYLAASQWLGRRWVKEAAVAICYAGGIMLYPVYTHFNATCALLFGQLLLLAFVNLVTFSLFEEQDDRIEGFFSIVTQLGYVKTRMLAGVVLLVLSLSLWVEGQSIAFLAFVGLGSLLYTSMHVFPDFFQSKDRYRLLGDSYFIMAIIFLLF